MGGKMTNPPKRLCALEARNINTVYQADSDGFISFTVQMGNQGIAYLKSDSSNPPAAVLAEIHGDWGNGIIPCQIAIKRRDYYKIEYSGAGTIRNIYWTPLR